MKKGIKKIMSFVSIILCITLLSSISTQVLAETIGKNNDETPSNPNFSNVGDGTEVGNIVSEITENRDKYTKHFRLDDGTFMAVNYVVPVHYKTKSGKWVEYDNSLVKENVESSSNDKETKYSNKKSNIDVDLSANSREDELVSLNTSKGNISWKYVDSNNSKAKVVNGNEKLEGNQKFTTLQNLSSEVNYNNIYDNTDLQCFISSTGVKENIILKNTKANNEFQIQYDIQDLKTKQVDEQTINLIKDGKVAYTITAPYMYDANGEQSSKVSLKVDRIQDNKLYVNIVADNNNLIAMMQGGVVAYFYYDSNNSVTAMSINDSMYYYIKNLQGDITKIVNHQGKVMVEYTYDAWGNILKEKSNVTPSYATVKEFNPFRYRGYVYDTDTGLYYLQSRYYDPKTGRFINADDTAYVDTNSGTPLSTNMFAYCENNHINKTDPNGCYNIKNFNCYAYAFGISNLSFNPGGGKLPSYFTVDYIVSLVLKDFKGKVRKLNGKNSKLKKGEYRIAVRTCPYAFVPKDGHCGPYIVTFDYHFWKQDPKTLKWWNKHGKKDIQFLGKVNPNVTKCKGWLCSKSKIEFWYRKIKYITTYAPIYYESKTMYLAYKGKFWSR